ncbi:MAG: YbaK/EbsC family protein [Planctomycetota bacterium]
MNVLEEIKQRLDEHSAAYDVLQHEPVFTSEEAAEVRGTPLSSGAKALVCKCDQEMVLFVMPADRRLAGKVVRRLYGWKKLRFATREEVDQLTGLKPGSIPPFGSLFGLSTYCDERLSENETINFNAGRHEISISMTYEDYVRVEQPTLETIAE